MKGTVTKVSDGDTLTVDFHGLEIKCRIANVDAPELRRPHGKQAKEFLETLCLNREIAFEVRNRDAFNRFVVSFDCDGVPVDQLLVQSGNAFHWAKYSEKEELETYQAQARRLGLGVWAAGTIEKHFCHLCPSS